MQIYYKIRCTKKLNYFGNKIMSNIEEVLQKKTDPVVTTQEKAFEPLPEGEMSGGGKGRSPLTAVSAPEFGRGGGGSTLPLTTEGELTPNDKALAFARLWLKPLPYGATKQIRLIPGASRRIGRAISHESLPEQLTESEHFLRNLLQSTFLTNHGRQYVLRIGVDSLIVGIAPNNKVPFEILGMSIGRLDGPGERYCIVPAQFPLGPFQRGPHIKDIEESLINYHAEWMRFNITNSSIRVEGNFNFAWKTAKLSLG